MTTDLAALARAAVAKHNVTGPGGSRLLAVRDLRIAHLATGAHTLSLKTYVDAIMAAIAQPFDPNPYLVDSLTIGRSQTWWLYRFPNGRDASVIPDPARPFHFEIGSTGYGPAGVKPGLTTEQLLAELARIRDLPAVIDQEPDTDARLDELRTKLAAEPTTDCTPYCTEFEHHNH